MLKSGDSPVNSLPMPSRGSATMSPTPRPMSALETTAEVARLLAAHNDYRAHCLNLVASENVISSSVARALAGDLEGRYADYTGTDLTARKYRGGRYVVELEQLCEQLVLETFKAEMCELRAISGHVAGCAVIMGVCRPGDLVLEVGQEGGGHRLGDKLRQARLVDLRVEWLPFDADAFTVDADAAAGDIREKRPALVILGSSTFLHRHPVSELVAACREVGAVLAYDASHVMGLVAAGRFQSPLAEGAQVVFGSTHKTLFGPQGGLIFGERELVALAAAALYPPLVTNHHPFRIPALAIALAEHAEFGAAYADAVIMNARAFAGALVDEGVDVVTRGTDSHAVLIATGERPGADLAIALEAQRIIVNPSRLPASLGGEGVRFGVQELTRRGGDVATAERAGRTVARALAGEEVTTAVSELGRQLSAVHYTWTQQ
jgi:glycine hydroxymethyltransferase